MKIDWCYYYKLLLSVTMGDNTLTRFKNSFTHTHTHVCAPNHSENATLSKPCTNHVIQQIKFMNELEKLPSPPQVVPIYSISHLLEFIIFFPLHKRILFGVRAIEQTLLSFYLPYGLHCAPTSMIDCAKNRHAAAATETRLIFFIISFFRFVFTIAWKKWSVKWREKSTM